MKCVFFRSLIKDFEKRPFVDDLLQHTFVNGIQVKAHIVSNSSLSLLVDFCSSVSIFISQGENRALKKLRS